MFCFCFCNIFWLQTNHFIRNANLSTRGFHGHFLRFLKKITVFETVSSHILIWISSLKYFCDYRVLKILLSLIFDSVLQSIWTIREQTNSIQFNSIVYKRFHSQYELRPSNIQSASFLLSIACWNHSRKDIQIYTHYIINAPAFT